MTATGPQPKQQVADDPAAQAHDHGEQQRPNDVEAFPSRDTRAGQGSDHHGGQINPQRHLERMNQSRPRCRDGRQVRRVWDLLH